jgi:gliding motility-associated-like protein
LRYQFFPKAESMKLSIYKSTLPIFLLLLSGTFASARGKHPATGEVPKIPANREIDFVENKGQWISEAKYKTGLPGGVVFITNKGFVYNYSSKADLNRIHEKSHEQNVDVSNEIVHHHAYKVNFSGANSGVTYRTEGKKKNYYNYFLGNNQANWASNVAAYGKVIQENVYQGIDVAVYSKEYSLKYDFIVSPGSDVNQIALTFDGVQPEITAEGNLKIKTSVNEVIEQAPYSYQVIDEKEVIVPSSYKLTNGKLTFHFPQGYDHSKTLVIDPTLIFATYSGGTGQANYSLATTYDADGNLYAGSYAYGLGWPVTTGAFQNTFAGTVDVAVNKYSTLGSSLIYSTFYGGSSSDLPHAMIVNDQNELIIAGSTTSSNLPLSTNSYDNSLSGGTDIFVAHFNSTATGLIGSTYIGGASIDPLNFSFAGAGGLQSQNTTSPVEVNFDNTGNIWVVGATSSTDFPVTTNAYQSIMSGSQDGVIFKLNPACSQLLYSSFLGGSGTDCISAIQFNSSGNAVVCGSTQSTDFPTTTGALHATAPGGTFDGFVSIFNQSTGAVIASTYVGTDDKDQAVNLQVDQNNNIYVLGRTMGAYPISAGVYNISDGDVFIDKLNTNLTASILSTRIGTAQGNGTRYFPTAFLYDICENIYVAGLGGLDPFGSSTTLPGTLPVTNDAFSTVADNFYFIVLEPNFNDILFGSYYGSDNDDHTHSGVNRLDKQGVVYHSVCSAASNFPTTPGVYSPTKQNVSGQDIISFKFDFEATGVQSNFELDPLVSGNDTGCVPYTVHFVNNSTSAEDYVWDFGDGSPTSNLSAPTHIYTVPGIYTVTLHASNDSSCITDDTAYMTITVLETNPPNFTVNDTTLCTYSQAIDIGLTLANPSPNNTILWEPSTGILTAPNQPVITVDPSVNNVYWVTVKDTIPGICGFSATDTVHIDLSPRVLDILNNDTVVCEGAIIPINAIGTPGYTYVWSPAVGVSDTTALEPNITINQPNLYTLTASYPNCPDTAVTINFDMHYIPDLELGPDKYACQWTDVALEATITPFRNDYIYQWTPATPNLSNPTGPNTHFITDTTITYHLNVQTPIGCSDNDSIKITVYPGAFGAIASDTGYCPGNQANLWATGGVSYSWTPAYGLSDTSIANPVASPGTTTYYTVYITDQHNCADTERVTVYVYPEAVLALPDSVNVYPGEQYHVEPETNALYFTWFPPSGLSSTTISDPLMSPEVRTRYFVTATTENGCVVSDSMDILVKETVIDMPNAFAPSGTNNLFKPSKRGIAQLKSFNVFNRWGNKVYSSTNIDQGWDGTFNDKEQPMGVYIYVIEAVTDKGKTFTQQGNVTLIR